MYGEMPWIPLHVQVLADGNNGSLSSKIFRTVGHPYDVFFSDIASPELAKGL